MSSLETTYREDIAPISQAVMPVSAGLSRADRSAELAAVPRRAGYGLPCAKCKTYYAADLSACPVCKSPERVSPTEGETPATIATAEQLPDPATLEEERERFLRDFHAKMLAAPLEVQATESFRCDLSEHHDGGFEPAAVCRGCYDHVLEQANLMEAALHIDLQEAASIVYDAVWSDPSDSTKTYINAAQALLNEMRRRAGISLVLGPLQPLSH
jgi:hypothetical protein